MYFVNDLEMVPIGPIVTGITLDLGSTCAETIPLQKIGAYKIPHLQSQFPPNPKPT